MTIRRRPALILTLIAALTAATAPAASAAAAPTGALKLTVGGKGANAAGTVAAGAPATRKGTALALPVTNVAVNRWTATIGLGGTLTFKRGQRTVTFRALRTTVTATSATLSGVLAGRRTAIARASNAKGKPNTVAGAAVTVPSATWQLQPAAGAALKRGLRLRRAPAGAFARGGLTAAAAGGSVTPTGPTTPTTPTGPTTPTTPSADPLPLLARPAMAIPVAAATITWHVRDSFVQYLSAGSDAGDGATAVAPTTSDAPSQGCTSDGRVNDALLAYQFHFPFSSGWYDPASGTAALYYSGAVHFGYKAHTIDLTTQNPEIELNGAASRAIFKVSGSGGTASAAKRASLVDLGLAKAPLGKTCTVDAGPSAPAGSGVPAAVTNPDGTHSYTYERLPGGIPSGAADSVFAGYYFPGDPFGWISVSFTTS